MKKWMLLYGGIAGLIVSFGFFLSHILSDVSSGMRFSELAGYLFMITALSMIFLGIKKYRDRELGGVIKFGTAFTLGLGITVVASVIYVAAWEVNLALTDYGFVDEYSEYILEEKKAEGLQGAALQAEVTKMESFKEQYANPAFRLPMTFLEIFPVGLLITLLSAMLLRRSTFLPASP